MAYYDGSELDDAVIANDDLQNASAEESVKVCKVYDVEDSFTSIVQLVLAGVALASLYLKRQQEIPRRKFETWFLDVSKQGIGAVYAHVLNMVIAALIVANVRGDFTLEDECAWYATMYVMDTVFGLLLSIYFLRCLDQIANQHDWTTLKHSGVYVGQDRYLTWGYQMIAWLVILSAVKLILTFVMWLFSPFLAYWASILFKPFQANPRVELLFVMIVFPGLLNVIWFWITDHFLKAEKHHAGAHENNEVDTKTETLLERETNENIQC